MPVRCPTCSKSFEPDQTTAMPFCCEECRMADLARWLNEQMGMPVVREEEEPPPPDDEHSRDGP